MGAGATDAMKATAAPNAAVGRIVVAAGRVVLDSFNWAEPWVFLNLLQETKTNGQS